MSVSEDEVRHIAMLARIDVEGEVAGLARDVSRILEFAEVLRGLDDDGSADSAPQLRGGRAATRDPGADDADTLHAPPADLAPAWAEGFFLVPPPPGLGADEAS